MLALLRLDGIPVQKSLMPKGVDHAVLAWGVAYSTLGAKIFDAERR